MQGRVDLKNSSDGQTRPYDELPLTQLSWKLDSALAELERAKSLVSEIQDAQQRRVQEAVNAGRMMLGKSEGTLTIKFEGCEVKATKPKKVKWDQAKLISAMNEIVSITGDDFVKVEYSIPERAFEALPINAQKKLSVARTLSHGAEKFEITPEEVPF